MKLVCAFRSTLSSAVVLGAFFVACSSGSTDSESPRGGASGSGSAGSGGRAGAAGGGAGDTGRGGQSAGGAAGQSSGGAGQSGKAGSGGAGPSGGASGSSGEGGASTAGRGGGGAAGIGGGTGGAAGTGAAGSDNGPPPVPMSEYANTNPTTGASATFQVLMDPQFKNVAGALWLADSKRLLLADRTAAKIWQWDVTNAPTEWLAVPGKPASVCATEDGKMLVLETSPARVMKMDPATKQQTLVVDHPASGSFGDLVDCVVDRNGITFVTDSRSDPQKGTITRVSRIGKGGDVKTLAEVPWGSSAELSFDEQFLVVASEHHRFRVDLQGDSASQPMPYIEGSENGRPMCVDLGGHMYIPSKFGIDVFKLGATPERLGGWGNTIYGGEGINNCAFGGDDGRTVFFTKDDRVFYVKVGVPGRSR